jgi:uncharacterized protein GlcG (DUF336 family)
VKTLALILGALVALGTAAFSQLTSNDVATIIAQAATRASVVSTDSVIAVVDREGYVLGVWSVNGSVPPNGLIAEAIARAGTAAFLSTDKNAFTTRTALTLVQQHFPPIRNRHGVLVGVRNKPTGPLVGLTFSSLPFSDVNRYKNPANFVPGMGGGTNGAPVPTPPLGSLDGFPGGVPLYRNGTKALGGVGVAGGPDTLNQFQADINENVALAGQIGFAPANRILGSHVLIAGIRLPYIHGEPPKVPIVAPLGSIGTIVPGFPVTNSPTVSYPTLVLGGVTGEVRNAIVDDPLGNLSSTDVTNILTLAAQRCELTRAAIRLPRGQSARMVITVVSNPASNGVSPAILGTFRMLDSTMFSWDICVQKARTVIFFSSALATNFLPAGLPAEHAYSARAIGFLAEQFYPPGIDGKPAGPLLGAQEFFSGFPAGVTNPLNGAVLATSPGVDPNLPNGMTIFPGAFPLYRNGVLIGAVSVSGDGVDQDDFVAIAGTVGFEPPANLRSDQIIFRGTRLPYAKFPRNPLL